MTSERKTIAIKYLEFRKNGLIKYGKYLEEQLKLSKKKGVRLSYKNYLQKEIMKNKERIAEINRKLK